MPFAVTHVLVPIIILELCRDNFKKCTKFFSRRHVFLVGIAGLLPDMDVVVYTAFNIFKVPFTFDPLVKRVLFENFWIMLSFFGFFLLFYYLLPKMKPSKKLAKKYKGFGKVFIVLFIGWAIHLLLDIVLTGNAMPLYPLNSQIIDYDVVGKLETVTGIPQLTILVSMDALLLLFWLWHEEMEHHIKDYF